MLTRGGGAAVTLPVPARVALVYATPVGDRPLATREIIYRASPTGTHAVRLAVGADPAISPDGRWVAYVGGTVDQPRGLRLIGSAGGSPRPLPVTSRSPVAWSPDSRLLAASRERGVTIVDVRSGRATTIRLPEASGGFSFSPGGRTLAFQHSTGRGPDIYAVSTGGGAVRRLTDDGRSESPLWGRAGSR